MTLFFFDNPDFRIAKKTSTLLCIEGGSAGRKIALTEQDVCFGNKLCCFFTQTMNPKFIYYFLQTQTFKSNFSQKLSGLIGGVNVNKLKEALIPLPPLDEQNRIVEKIENIFKQLQILEKSLGE